MSECEEGIVRVRKREREYLNAPVQWYGTGVLSSHFTIDAVENEAEGKRWRRGECNEG